MLIGGPRVALMAGMSRQGFYNFSGDNLKRTQTALAAQRNGISNARILAYGDSTTIGTGTGPSGPTNLDNAKVNSWPSMVANILPGGSNSSFMGDNGTNDAGEVVSAYDPHITLGADWGSGVGTTAGGYFLSGFGPTSLTFLPSNPVDTFEIRFATFTGNGTAAVNVNGGSTLTTLNGNAPDSIAKSTVSAPLASNTLNIVPPDDTGFYLQSVIAYNSAIKEVQILNGGWWGADSGTLSNASLPYNQLPTMAGMGQNLTIMENGIVNDWQFDTLATSKTNNQALITAALAASSDVILMSGVPSDPSKASYLTQYQFVEQMRALAYSNKIPMIDIWTLFGGTYQPTLMYDAVHPNLPGYTKIANYVLQALNPSFRAT